MTTITENNLVITIPTTDAAEYRDWLITAIAAAFRWKAGCSNLKTTDDENAGLLAEMLEELAMIRE